MNIFRYIYLKQYYRCLKNNIIFFRNGMLDRKNEIGSNVYLGENTRVLSSHISGNSYISNDSSFSFTYIGKYCSIGPYVKTAVGKHPTKKFVSTHPAFYSADSKKVYKYTYVNQNLFDEHDFIEKTGKKYAIVIENDVWIGANVTLLEGIRIGNGAIVGAGAVVSKDVPEYSIVVGNPARIIRYRFNKNIINKLNDICWWNWSEETIINEIDTFSDISSFMYRMGEEN